MIVVAHRRQYSGFLSQQGQYIGDVPGGAAQILLQSVDRKTHVNHVNLVGHDVVGKTSGEVHDSVISH